MAEKFEQLYQIVDSKLVRMLVDDLVQEYGRKMPTQELRYALARMLWRYLQLASNVYKYSRWDINRLLRRGR